MPWDGSGGSASYHTLKRENRLPEPSYLVHGTVKLRACLRRSWPSQALDHQASQSKRDHGFAALCLCFIILDTPATVSEPSTRSLDDPAPVQHNETKLVVTSQHWLEAKTT